MKSKLKISLLFLIAGAALFLQGWRLDQWRDEYVEEYNAGLAAYLRYPTSKNGKDLEEALAKFAKTRSIYDQSLGTESKAFAWYPRVDRRLAALADFQQGKIYALLGDAEKTVEAWKSSLAINPGNDYAPEDWGWMLSSRARLLANEANDTRYNLEHLFKNNKSQAQSQGKGGQGKQRQTRQQSRGQQPQPGDRPGQKGKSNKGQKSGKGNKPGKGSQPGSGGGRPL